MAQEKFIVRSIAWSALVSLALLAPGCGKKTSGSAAATGSASSSASASASAAAKPALPTHVFYDGREVTAVGVETLNEPILVLDLLPKDHPTLDQIPMIAALGMSGERIEIDSPGTKFPGAVPTLFRANGVVGFAMRKADGTQEAEVLNATLVEVFSKVPKDPGDVERLIVVGDKPPVKFSEDMLDEAMGFKKRGSGKGRGGGDGSGEGEGDGSGSGSGSGSGKGGSKGRDGGGSGSGMGGSNRPSRDGVPLAKFVAFVAKGFKVKEVVLKGGEDTFTADAKTLKDPKVDLRLKISGEGELRFRHYDQPKDGQNRGDTLKQIDDVERIEIR